MSESNPNLDARVARLEVSVEGLHNELSGVTEKLDTLIQSRGVNWPAIAIVVTIAGLSGALINKQMGYVDDKVRALTARVADHEKIDGHAEALIMDARTEEKINALDRSINHGEEQHLAHGKEIDLLRQRMVQEFQTLDINLQREMRDRDEILKTEITALDTRLQNEMDLKIKPLTAILDAIMDSRWTKDQGAENKRRIERLEAEHVGQE